MLIIIACAYQLRRQIVTLLYDRLTLENAVACYICSWLPYNIRKTKHINMKNHIAPTSNLLYDIHTMFGNFSWKFKEMVREECNWSNPTYYRKMRDSSDTGDKQIKQYLSRAEAEAVLKQARAAVEILNVFIKNYKETGIIMAPASFIDYGEEEQEVIYFESEF